MARRFTTISGLGRCTVILEGSNGESRQRVRLAHHVDTGLVYFVHTAGSKSAFSHVTGWPTMALLEKLDHFEWWIPLGSVDEGGAD
ncbi:hypothetical protein BH09CHL1_BH09CHL1_03960 [soil metagenome]